MKRHRSLNWLVGGALALAVGILASAPFVERAHAAGTVPGKAIELAIGILEHKGDRSAYTKAGKPRVKALETILGEDISAAERDTAWKAFKAPKPLPDTASLTALNGEIATLKSTLKASTAGRHRAETDLGVAKKELAAALRAHSALQRKARQDIEAARNDAVVVKARYNRLMADAERERAAAARTKREASARLAEAKQRERGAGPSSSRSCREAIDDVVLNGPTTWVGNLKLDDEGRARLRVACLQ